MDRAAPTGEAHPPGSARDTPPWAQVANVSRPDSGRPGAPALPGEGRPLDRDVAATLQPRLGFDLGPVRVHDDPVAGRQAQELGALAYTWGNHVGFAPGAYQPRASDGRELLAHELAHVGQQLAGDTSDEIAQERQADAVERGGALSSAAAPFASISRATPATPRPRPVLRLRPGDALSLTVTVGERGRASFSVEVEGGGSATATGTAANLPAGEYQVRSTGADLVITDPSGVVVPRTTRFDIGWSSANAALLRALARATAAIPLHVTTGSVPAGGGGGAAPDPDSEEGRRQRLAALPDHIRNFLFSSGSGPGASPEDLATLLRIAASLADLSEVELAEYRARTTGGTTDVAAFEAGVNRWLADVRARRTAEAEQEHATMALLGMDAVYELYRSWQTGLLMGGPPSWIYEWEAQPTSALPSDRDGTMNQLYLRLRRSLESFGYPNLAAFTTAVNRFVTAFRETAVHVGRDLLDRYEHTLLEQQSRYAGGSAGLHGALAPARTTYREADVHMRAAMAPNTHESTSADDRALEEAASYARLHTQGQAQVRGLAAAHPLVANRDFPVDQLGRAEDETAVTAVINDYITVRLGNVRDTRARINADHEIVFDLDVLVTTTKARRGIEAGTLWDRIIQDHQAPTLAEIERNLMIMTLAVGLGLLTAGTGSLAVGAVSLVVSSAQALQTYAEYAAQSDAYGAQLLSEEPSLAWVVLAIVAVVADLAVVGATIRPIRGALQAFQRTGDLAELEARLAGVEERIRRSILARAEIEAQARRGWQGLFPPGALRGSAFGLDLIAEQFGKLVYAVQINLRRGVNSFLRWRATREAIDLIGDANQLTPAQLRQLGDLYTRGVADAQRIAVHGRSLGMSLDEIDDAIRVWAQRGTGTADDVMREMTAARGAVTPDGARPPTADTTTPGPSTVEPTTPRTGETVEPATPRTGETVEPAWTPPRSWNGPANHGRWSGVRGDSGWIDDRAEVIRIVGRGAGGEANPIPFRRGVVDFSPWSRGELSVAGLTGEHANDMRLIRLAIADREGLAVGASPSARQAAALDWLRTADDGFGGTGLRPHHAGGNRIQLIPRDVHKVQHTDLAVYAGTD